MNTSATRMYLAIALLVALVIGAVALTHHSSTEQSSTSNTPTEATTSAMATTTTNTDTLTITAQPSAHAPKATTPLVFSAQVSPQVQASIKKSFEAAQASIAKNPLDLESWIALGVARKQAGDYQGAILDWQYVSAASPSNVVSFHNLGDLYQNYLHDYPKAVAAFKQAIVNNPKDIDAYKALFTIYTSASYQAPQGAAEAILKEGIAKNPKAYDLQVLLARYYRSLGENAQAKAEYDAAIANAQAQGETTVATQLKTEEVGL